MPGQDAIRRPSKPAFTCAHRHENYGLTTPTHRCPVAVVHCSCGRGAVYIVRRDPICPITLAGRKVCPDNGHTHTHKNMCRRRLWRGRHTQTQTDRPATVGQLNRWNRNDYKPVRCGVWSARRRSLAPQNPECVRRQITRVQRSAAMLICACKRLPHDCVCLQRNRTTRHWCVLWALRVRTLIRLEKKTSQTSALICTLTMAAADNGDDHASASSDVSDVSSCTHSLDERSAGPAKRRC